MWEFEQQADEEWWARGEINSMVALELGGGQLEWPTHQLEEVSGLSAGLLEKILGPHDSTNSRKF